MGIFCVGQAVYDITAPYTGPLLANQKYRITTPHGCSGAPALNAACLCSLWGAPTQLVARIGDDAYGALIRADLQRYGVGTSYLIPDSQVTTGYSFIAVDDATGDRTIFNVPSVMHDVVYPTPGETPDVMLFDGHEPAVSLQLVEEFPHAQTVIDAGTYRESTYEVARVVDYLVCSEDFARQYAGEVIDDPGDSAAVDRLLKSIEKINGGVAVITLGDRGLVYRDDEGTPRHMPAFKAHAVDTTGAGDIFHGAFAYGLFEGMTLSENLRQCSMTSSLSVRALGGLTSIPPIAEVRSELASVA